MKRREEEIFSERSHSRQNRFEPMAYHLWNGSLVNERNIKNFTTELGSYALEQIRDHDAIAMLAEYVKPSDYLSMLESSVFRLALMNGDEPNGKEIGADPVRLLPSISALVIAVYRMQSLQKLVYPQIGQSFAYNTLFMICGESPNAMEELAFDSLLCAYIHVPEIQKYNIMLDSMRLISTSVFHWRKREKDRSFEKILQQAIAEVEGIKTYPSLSNIGFTNSYDYRCGVLDHFAFVIGKQRNELTLYKTVKKLELQQAKAGLYPHLDLYAVLLMYYLRIPTELFASLVCLGKISGWLGKRVTFNNHQLM